MILLKSKSSSTSPTTTHQLTNNINYQYTSEQVHASSLIHDFRISSSSYTSGAHLFSSESIFEKGHVVNPAWRVQSISQCHLYNTFGTVLTLLSGWWCCLCKYQMHCMFPNNPCMCIMVEETTHITWFSIESTAKMSLRKKSWPSKKGEWVMPWMTLFRGSMSLGPAMAKWDVWASEKKTGF